MTVTLAQLKRAAERIGVTIERSPPSYRGDVEFEMIAPEGKIFGELGSQTVVWEEYSGIGKGDYSSQLRDLETLIDGEAN